MPDSKVVRYFFYFICFKILYLMKVLAFGDSFVKMFIHCESSVKYRKFKGKSIKGLVKEQDNERKTIEKEIRKASKGTRVLLMFGQVDFNYVRYFKAINGQNPISQQTFKNYIRWVSSMNKQNNISVISILPSPIKRENVIGSLIMKKSYLPEQRTEELDNKILEEFEKTEQTWARWNGYLEKYCKQYSVSIIKLFSQNKLLPQFYDISNFTIHLRYIPVLKLVQKYVNICFDEHKAEEEEKKYEQEKVTRLTSTFLIDQFSQFSSSLPKEVFERIEDIKRKGQKQIQKGESTSQTQKKVQRAEWSAKKTRKQTADLDTDSNIEKENQLPLKALKTNEESSKNDSKIATIDIEEQVKSKKDQKNHEKSDKSEKKNNQFHENKIVVVKSEKVKKKYEAKKEDYSSSQNKKMGDGKRSDSRKQQAQQIKYKQKVVEKKKKPKKFVEKKAPQPLKQNDEDSDNDQFSERFLKLAQIKKG